MRAQPTAQQRPKPFHGIHMHFTQAVAIFVSSEFASSVVDTFMVVAPGLQTSINAVLVRFFDRARSSRVHATTACENSFQQSMSAVGLVHKFFDSANSAGV